jgi:hypothetical protein
MIRNQNRSDKSPRFVICTDENKKSQTRRQGSVREIVMACHNGDRKVPNNLLGITKV